MSNEQTFIELRCGRELVKEVLALLHRSAHADYRVCGAKLCVEEAYLTLSISGTGERIDAVLTEFQEMGARIQILGESPAAGSSLASYRNESV